MSSSGLQSVPNQYRYDYAGACWWCGEVADSREHKWKRSEVVNVFGRGSYGDSVLWVHGDTIEPVQGSKASGLKFSATLCASCNNANSQPFDRAYERFSNHLIANHRLVVDRGWIDLTEVYGDETGTEVPKLARYYAKHIGCRVAEQAGKVPDALRDFLNGDSADTTFLYSEFGIREALLNIVENDKQTLGLSLRKSVAHYSEVPGVGLTTFKSGVGLGAVEFLYDVNLDGPLNATGNGILSALIQPLFLHDEDLYAHTFTLG